MAIWYIFLRFGMLYQEKSGNPAQVTKRACVKYFILRVIKTSLRTKKSKRVRLTVDHLYFECTFLTD
jgi:hypothetical protein